MIVVTHREPSTLVGRIRVRPLGMDVACCLSISSTASFTYQQTSVHTFAEAKNLKFIDKLAYGKTIYIIHSSSTLFGALMLLVGQQEGHMACKISYLVTGTENNCEKVN